MKILAVINKNADSEGGPVYLLKRQKLFFNSIANYNLRIFETDKISLIKILYFFFFNKKKIIDILKNVDIIHFHVFWNLKNIFLAYIALDKKIPYFFSIHGHLDAWSVKRNFYLKKIFLFLFKKIFLFSSGYQMSTYEEVLESKKFFNLKKIFILPNGVDVNLNSDHNNFDNKKKIKLIFFGRLHFKKGIEIFLESFNLLDQNEKSRFGITIVGPGKLHYIKKLKKKINILNLLKYVKILPAIYKTEQKINLLRKFSVFFLTSYEEADSIAIKEAMAFGLPVIISKQCRLPDVVKYNCGFVVNTSQESILKCLKKLCKINNFSTMSINSIKLVKKKFDILKMNNSLLKIYSDIIKKKSDS
jgi:glycosyltransferase involved in cell wall biosynthesis